MAVNDIFSKRQKRLRGEVPDVFSYDVLPLPLRVQLYSAVVDMTGNWYRSGNPDRQAQAEYAEIIRTLRLEYGVFELGAGTPRRRTRNLQEELRDHILEAPAEEAIDAIELACRNALARTMIPASLRQRIANAVAEVNYRFREHGVGYEFVNGQMIRIDSQLVHAEAVKPALQLLHQPGYEGPLEEFHSGYEHYRAGKTKEALTDALKAFESTMKVIAKKRGWPHDPGATANPLVKLMLDNGLIPAFWQGHMSGLRQVLESGIPTARNRKGGHGQGATPERVPDELAGYVLHMTAATIVFLVKAEAALPKGPDLTTSPS
jgi:hypothetical protein